MPKASSNLNQVEDLSLVVDLQQELVTSTLPLSDLLSLVCRKAQEITLASGAVVELVDGEDMVYKACTPSLQSSLGVRLKVSSSLSGHSVRSQQVIYCADSEIDDRVDRDACRKIGVRSMICVPLTSLGKTVGVLKVISPEQDGFHEREVKILRVMAGLVSAKIAQAAESDAKDKALASLKENEQLFRTMFHSAFESIVVTKQGSILFVNGSFSALCGFEPSELIGRPLGDLVAPESQERYLATIKQDMNARYELIALRKDGTKMMIEASGATTLLDGEKIRISTIRDITLRKRSEEMLKKSEQESREANRMKSDFLANMSHEIRTPINGVMGIAGLLLDTDLNAQQRHYTELIKVSADTLLNVVNDVLDFSKVEAGKATVEKIDFDLHQVLEDIQNVMSVMAERKQLELKHFISPSLPTSVVGDPTKIRQVLANLVTNAIKFTEKGHVTIRAVEQSLTNRRAVLRFEVVDSGIGISDNARDRMFKPFSQADTSTTRRFGGTGLGLSICKKLVEVMGGEIGLDSVEGRGTTFWFVIPFEVAAKQEKRTRKTKVIDLPPKLKLRILIAEDNAINQLIAIKMVEKMGHTATKVANGREAIEALTIAPYDLILMDCQMPEMDGYEATRSIRTSPIAEFRAIPIIAMTANALSGDREKCLDAGMNDYISKPMKVEDLRTVIDRTFELYKQTAS